MMDRLLRPQTWYLLLAAVCTAVCCIAGAGTALQLVLLIVAAVTTVAVVPLFKNLKLQAALCLLPMLLVLAWYVLLAARSDATLRWQYILPAVAEVCMVMARRGIAHDARVLRSYERIR